MQHLMRKIGLVISLCLCLQSGIISAQHAPAIQYKNRLTVKAFGVSFHLKESPHPEIFPNKIDKNGYITMNYGAIVGYDRLLVRDVISVRLEQALYADCSASMAGFTHIGWRGLMFRKNRHSMNGGFGPTLVYRRDWNRLEGYIDEQYFNTKKGWQYKFYWYAAEFEYNYQLAGRTDLSLTLIPGLPELVAFAGGIRHHF